MKIRTISAAIGALLAGSLIAAPNAAGADDPAARDFLKFKVVTTNTMLLPSVISDGLAQDVRGELIGKAPYLVGNDVVVFQELFDDTATELLMDNLKGYPNRTPVIGRSRDGWSATRGNYSSLPYEDGGVAIASRWPISRKIQYIFYNSCGADTMAEKGLAYAKIDYPGSPVHVIGTHLQADDDGCDSGEAAKVRKSQMGEITSFVDSLGIPAGERVIYAGDMNIDRHRSEYPALAGGLHAVPPTYAGHPYTSDPQTNSVAKLRYPNARREWLDYVFYDNRHAHPASYGNSGQAVTSPLWELDDVYYNRYSDHYPVTSS
ncbi:MULTISPECIES: sphingomyelin phosphodiesterase [Streptomyces]|uniref:Sphingomyelin phosphodiesterase n=1 Tax=Streptomyces achmelvichensis TaxID=3134111 RepID=A0ACC6PLD7_9ACTN|nr:sphingomyelin phosphodiesterase [Streptomyces sp. NBC_00306]